MLNSTSQLHNAFLYESSSARLSATMVTSLLHNRQQERITKTVFIHQYVITGLDPSISLHVLNACILQDTVTRMKHLFSEKWSVC